MRTDVRQRGAGAHTIRRTYAPASGDSVGLSFVHDDPALLAAQRPKTIASVSRCLQIDSQPPVVEVTLDRHEREP